MTERRDTYSHGHHDSVLRSHRWRTAQNSAGYLLAELDELGDDAVVLDVGCGPGTITLDLARRVPSGRVVGIDLPAAVLDAATADAVAQGVDNVRFERGDVYAIDAPDAFFDVVHAHQVLQHLSDPVAALREMRRVCRPGGIVAARDSDYSAMTWYPESPRLDRWLDLYLRLARSNDAEPDAGRRLKAWATEAEFSSVSCSASAWCFASADERQWWSDMWAERVVASAFAEQVLDRGFASVADLDDLAVGWREWAAEADAWFSVLHGEVICRP